MSQPLGYLVFFALLALGFGYFYYSNPVSLPLTSTEETKIETATGTTAVSPGSNTEQLYTAGPGIFIKESVKNAYDSIKSCNSFSQSSTDYGECLLYSYNPKNYVKVSAKTAVTPASNAPAQTTPPLPAASAPASAAPTVSAPSPAPAKTTPIAPSTAAPAPVTASNTAPSDTKPPTVPEGLSGSAFSQNQVNLSWSVSTDNAGVKLYRVYRNGLKVGMPSGASFSDSGLSSGTMYSYTVAAEDSAGNISGQSSAIYVSTESAAVAQTSQQTAPSTQTQQQTTEQQQTTPSPSAETPAPLSEPVLTPTIPQTTSVSDSGTHYLAPNGSDASPGTETAPWATFDKAWSVLQPGNTLVVKNGAYTQALKPSISGTAGNPITIRAENDGGAILDGQGLRTGIEINKKSYITIEGFFVINPGERPAVTVTAPDSDYTSTHDIIIRRTGGRGGPKDTNGAAWSIARTRDSTLEDVWAFGDGRYAMNVYGSTNITVRRAVIRWDRWDGLSYKIGDPRFNLGIYDTHDSLFENILLIDAGSANASSDKGALYVPGNNNGATAPWTDSDNNKLYGVIALNNVGTAFAVEGGSGGTNDNNQFRDVVGWDNEYGISVNNKAVGTTFEHVTIAHNSGRGGWFNPYNNVLDSVVKNSLIMNHPSDGLRGTVASSYNNLYGNNPNYGSGSTGTNDYVPGKDPQLKYIVRLEPDSAGKGDASDGGDRGATVVNRYVNGALTSSALWPWPNESRIKQDMCDSSYLSSVGRTGTNASKWCSSGKTLTAYIWEYLGNSLPSQY